MKWFGRDKKKSESSSMTLSDIIRGIQYCVNSSVEIVEQHYINTINKYMNEDNEIRKERIYLDDGHYMDIPLICLTGHNALEVDKMKVKMRVNIRDMDLKHIMVDNETDTESEDGEASEDDSYTVSRSSMLVDVCNVSRDEDGANMEIQMTFKTSEPPESLSRIIESLNNSLVVKMKEMDTE